MPRPVRPFACLVAAVVITIAAAGIAHASAFRYWTYWRGDDGSWTFSSAGPAFVIPRDGAVDGWRFGVSTEAGSAAGAPRTEPSFGAICGDTPQVAGSKRVALVIDSGTTAEAPAGQSPPPQVTTCVVIADDATGYDVLRSVTTVGVNDKGLVCNVGGYPTGECAPVLSDDEVAAITSAEAAEAASPAASPTTANNTTAEQESPSESSAPWPTIAVVLLLFGVAGVAAWRRRRA